MNEIFSRKGKQNQFLIKSKDDFVAFNLNDIFKSIDNFFWRVIKKDDSLILNNIETNQDIPIENIMYMELVYIYEYKYFGIKYNTELDCFVRDKELPCSLDENNRDKIFNQKGFIYIEEDGDYKFGSSEILGNAGYKVSGKSKISDLNFLRFTELLSRTLKAKEGMEID